MHRRMMGKQEEVRRFAPRQGRSGVGTLKERVQRAGLLFLVLSFIFWSSSFGEAARVAFAAPDRAPAPKAEVKGTVTAVGNGGFTVTAGGQTYTVGASVKVASYPHAGGSTAAQVGDQAHLKLRGGQVVSASVLPPWTGKPKGTTVSGAVTGVTASSITVGGTAVPLLPQTLVVNVRGFKTPVDAVKVGDQVNVATFNVGGTATAGQVWLGKTVERPEPRPRAAVYMLPSSQDDAEDGASFGALAATTVPGGTLSANTTWGTSGSPYTVTGPVIVPPGITLTIRPGVTVKFAPGATLVVQGTLNATGGLASPQRITLRSAAASQTAYDWPGIQVSDASATGTATLRNVTISGGVCGVDTGGYNANLTLSGFTINAQLGGVCSGGAPSGTITGTIQNGSITLVGNGSAPVVGISADVLPDLTGVNVAMSGAGLGGFNAGVWAGSALGNVSGSSVRVATVPASVAGPFIAGISSGGVIGNLTNNTLTFTEIASGGAFVVGVQGLTVGASSGNTISFSGPSGDGHSNYAYFTTSQGGMSGDRISFAGLSNAATNYGVQTTDMTGPITGVAVNFRDLNGNPTNAGLQIASTTSGEITRTTVSFTDIGNADLSSFTFNTGVFVGGTAGAIVQDTVQFTRIKGFSTNYGLNLGANTGVICLNRITFNDILGGDVNLAFNTAVSVAGNVSTPGADGCIGLGIPGAPGGPPFGGGDDDDDDCDDDHHRVVTPGFETQTGGWDGHDDDCDDDDDGWRGHALGQGFATLHGGGDDDDDDCDGYRGHSRLSGMTGGGWGGDHDDDDDDDDDCDDDDRDDEDDEDDGHPNAGIMVGCATPAGIRNNLILFTNTTGIVVGNTGVSVGGTVYGGITKVTVRFLNGGAGLSDLAFVIGTSIDGPFACNRASFANSAAGSYLAGLITGQITGGQVGVSNNRIVARQSGAGSVLQGISAPLAGTSAKQLLVQHNLVSTDTGGESFGLDRIGDYVTFSTNTLEGPGAPASVPAINGEGLRVQGANATLTGTTLTCNIIKGWATGVLVDTPGATLQNNAITNNLFHVLNTGATTQVAQQNYWGGTPAAAQFVGLVDFTNHLTAAPACVGDCPQVFGN